MTFDCDGSELIKIERYPTTEAARQPGGAQLQIAGSDKNTCSACSWCKPELSYTISTSTEKKCIVIQVSGKLSDIDESADKTQLSLIIHVGVQIKKNISKKSRADSVEL